MAPVGRAFNANVSVPDDAEEAAERVLPKDVWISNYNRFDSDSITYGTPRPQYGRLSLKEAFRYYLDMLKRYPDLVIEDRLDGMNCVWNVGADGIVGIFRCSTSLEGDVEFRNAKLIDNENNVFAKLLIMIKKVTNEFYEFTTRTAIIDVLVWHVGIWIVLLLMSFAYLIKNKIGKMIWAIAPFICMLLTYVLVIGWQMYFYLWFFPLTVFVMLVVIPVIPQRKA